MNRYRAIQTIALNDIIKGTNSSQIHHIMRWWSREFSTPLHLVEELPLDYILQHYYEDCYENMSAEKRERERESLSLTEEEAIYEVEEADEFLETLKKVEKKKSQPTIPIADSVKKISPLSDAKTEELKKILADFKDIKVDF